MTVLEKVMKFDDHRNSDKINSISATTLLGSKYKAKKYLAKDKKNSDLVDIKFKRSSFIGTAIHSRFELILKDDEDYIVEKFLEREIEVDNVVYTVAGTFDMLQKIDNKWYIKDIKSGYGSKRKQEQLDKDAEQMSIYRWLCEQAFPEIDIEDTGYSIFISQSNNVMEELAVNLKSTAQVEYFIEEKIYQIVNQEMSDCTEGIKYNPCTYCDFECEERAI